MFVAKHYEESSHPTIQLILAEIQGVQVMPLFDGLAVIRTDMLIKQNIRIRSCLMPLFLVNGHANRCPTVPVVHFTCHSEAPRTTIKRDMR